MPATSAVSMTKRRSSLKRAKAPLMTVKSPPANLVSARTAVSATADDSSATASFPPTPSSIFAKAKRKTVQKSASVIRERQAEFAPATRPVATSPPRPSKNLVERQQQLQQNELSTQASADSVEEPAETCQSFPPKSASSSSDYYDFNVTSTSSVSDDFRDGVNAEGSVRRVPEQVTSLAGKRHTRVVMHPPHAAHSSSVFASLAVPLGGSGTLNSRVLGVSGRRGGPSGALGNVTGGGSGGGSGSHHPSDGALRYRTDLDKQVIHFMFERYHQEQICPTSAAPSTDETAWGEVSGASEASPAEATHSGRGHANRKAAGVATAGLQSSSSSPSPPSSLAPGLRSRARHMTLEEVYVPSNGDGEDKHIGLGDWHFFWMHVSRVRHTVCSSDFRWQDRQIINHFPDHAELTRKDLMYKNIKRYLRENQANNYARLTLHTATDWVSAAANAMSPFSAAAGAAGSGTVVSPVTPPPAGSPSDGHVRSTKTFCFADGVPVTYNLPNDLSMFKEECQKHRGTQWIVKPTSRSQGKGIFIIDDVRALQRWMKEKKDAENTASFLATRPANRASWVAPSVLQQQRAAQQSLLEAAAASNTAQSSSSPMSPTGAAAAASSNPASAPAVTSTGAVTNSSAGGAGAYVVSRYISKPLLIGGKKFDLRLYVLVTSYKPLVAYLHEDGFARFCATRYNGGSLAQEDLGSHLTNVALQKGDEHYNTAHGGKWSFQNLFLYVQCRYGPYAAEGMMSSIQFLIYHSLKAVEPVIFNEKHSFELYGYDILIDEDINPHLIEVNASPSMSTTTVSDRLLKEQVLTDTMKIIFPPGFPANSKAMPYWEYRQRTDLTTQQQTGFKLLQF